MGLKKLMLHLSKEIEPTLFYDPCQTRPFINQFQKIFNSIGKDDRKKIVDLYMENESDPSYNL